MGEIILRPTLASIPGPASRRAAGRVNVPFTAVVFVLLAIPAFVDMPGRIKLGPISLMGVLTLAQVALLIPIVLACRSYPKHVVRSITPYAVFLAWTCASALWMMPTFWGVQNWAVYMLFGLAMLLSGTVAAAKPGATHAAVDLGIRWMDRIALGAAFVSLALRGIPGEETQWFLGERAFALLGLIPLSWHLAHWHAGGHRHLLRAWLWFMAIGLSLSRMALGISILFFVAVLLLQFRFTARSLFVKLPIGALAVGMSAAFILNSDAIEQRIFTGDTSLELGGLSINMSGRLNMWPVVIESARESPWIGKGLGSSQEVVTIFEYVGHPHNDYLRVWHDLGYVGLVLIVGGLVALVASLASFWWRSSRLRQPHAPLQMSALFAVVGLLIAGLTDNALIYPFVMGPLGTLVGAALGAGRPDRTAVTGG